MSVLLIIKRPTRYGEDCAILIDNILSNELYDNNLSGIILDDLSDHLPILFVTGDIVIPCQHRFITKRIRNFSDQTLCLLSNRLQHVSWENCRVSDVNLASEAFHHNFDAALNDAIPVTIKKCNSY